MWEKSVRVRVRELLVSVTDPEAAVAACAAKCP